MYAGDIEVVEDPGPTPESLYISIKGLGRALADEELHLLIFNSKIEFSWALKLRVSSPITFSCPKSSLTVFVIKLSAVSLNKRPLLSGSLISDSLLST